MPYPKQGVAKTRHISKRQVGELRINWIVRRNVLARRRELRITQRQLANLLGVSEPHMSHLETGRNVSEEKLVYFSLEMVEAAARQLLCEPFDLLVSDRFTHAN